MRRCYLGTALVLGGLLLTGVTPTGSCGIGTLTVYAAEDTFSGELVEAIQNEVVTEDNVETEIPTEETAEQVVVEETPEALTGNSFNLEDQEYQLQGIHSKKPPKTAAVTAAACRNQPKGRIYIQYLQ